MRAEEHPRSDSGGGPASPSGPVASAVASQLPKGGGAIKGIGEKFVTNPVTGTGSMSVPIVTSPGRQGFGPQLSLSYDSGAGNGPFGFGWRLTLPSITRKTDKGLPQYFDALESDVFILSGAEDLVPVYRQNAVGSWIRNPEGDFVIHEEDLDGYRIRRYRPRSEGLFARIERWSKLGASDDVHWRSISKDNVLTVYGLDANSRIADPEDATRIFTWLICETRDDKGNAVLYRYKAEDGQGVDLRRAHERNRGPTNDPRRTANRYLKRIHYGNATPLLDNAGARPRFLDKAEIGTQIANGEWMFEVVLDYGDHDVSSPGPRDDEAKNAGGAVKYPWKFRPDPFSTYRAGFEVRTTRLCQRVLMFHSFPGTQQDGVGVDCLVRSTDFNYSDEVDPTDVRNPVYAFLCSVAQTGYRRNNVGYDQRSLPPVEFEYTQPVVQDAIEEVDSNSLENLPAGLDGRIYRWIDLHGEGIPGFLTEQAGTWYYKRNLSPIPERQPDGRECVQARFAQLEIAALRPNTALGGSAEFMDLAGDGQPDVVVMDGPVRGLYEHDDAEGWQPFRAFASQPNRNLRDPNVRLIDLDGDGHADVLITEDDAFVWQASLSEQGFSATRRVSQPLDEEKGPRIVFADGTQSIYLADFSGDGLTDIIRIRNGEVCYWPNLGYGRFGAKITVDNSPWFDHPDQFDNRRIRLADIDGSGTSDILYLHRDGVRLYFNQSGNSWSAPYVLNVFPRIDDVANIVPIDLLGNGTTCLVWSSPLPGNARRQMRYVNLMGGNKPHLLVRSANNLGAETRIGYAPSTRFYLQDKHADRPWITRLPFPVHVVERVETYDHISHNRFVSRYAYHHGYFDGEEREFRGFGMVEQWDTEELAALAGDGLLQPDDNNISAASHVPPVLTKTWFHTGVYLGRDHVSDYFAGLLNVTDQGEYFREPGITDAEARALLLPDTVLPPDLTLQEEREACRALSGSMLRQEIYALDGSAKELFPYTVTEQNFSVRMLQPRGDLRHGVFLTHTREAISFHYERNPADPRIQHAMTLEVDAYGNVLKEAAIGYGRRTTITIVDVLGQVQHIANPGLSSLLAPDIAKQTTSRVTYTENRVTEAIETAGSHRNPLPCEMQVFELMGYAPTGAASRYQVSDLVEADPALPGHMRHIFDAEIAYEAIASGNRRRRLIECQRILFRRDDLSGPLPLGQLQSLALPFENYKLAFTPGLLALVYQRPRSGQPAESLIPGASGILAGLGAGQGGYLQTQTLKADGRFPAGAADDHWWVPSGRSFFTDNPADGAATELIAARQHFFLSRRHRDPFGQDTVVRFDGNDLLMVETRDALGNRVTVDANDYRALQPRLVSEPNGNQTELAFDILGMVVGAAIMGKPLPAPVEGDTLAGFTIDLTSAQLDAFFDGPDPKAAAQLLLQGATTRVVYDLDRFRRTRQAHPADPNKWQPACAATLSRETHVSDIPPNQQSIVQLSFTYSDGFSREIQTKMQAEPGPLLEGGVVLNSRWVGSGWSVFNNKGKPVRCYEPFFSATHRYEFGVAIGVSPVLFYDPVERVVATLHPNRTYEKVVFDPWQQNIYDLNDTCAPRNAQTGDPRTDPDIQGYVARYFASLPASPPAPQWQTWRQQRALGGLGPDEQTASLRAAAHADTPTTEYFDTLGRPFLTVARNRVVCPGHDLDGTEGDVATRVESDIEGNQREVRDAVQQAGDPLGRIAMRYAYDMLGNRIYQSSMEAGARWTLNDVTGKCIRSWDSRGHNFASRYDELRRLREHYVRGTTADSDPRTLNRDILVERIEYGEARGDAAALNLRTRIYRHADSSGVLTNARMDAAGNPTEAYDFKGNRLQSTRRLVADYTALPDWLLNPQLVDERFEASTRYDALNRPIQSIAAHSSLARAKRNVIQPVFNEASLLGRIDVWLGRAAEPVGLIDANSDPPSPVGVGNIDYDAKGRRLQIEYKNGASTRYRYDDETFRLIHVYTRRGATFTEDCENPLPPPLTITAPSVPPQGKACGLQNLHYTYDPAGNITHIQDDAQQTLYFLNKRVEPSNEYTYDALYRLIQATGREHLGQINGVSRPPTAWDSYDAFHARHDHPGDGKAMGTYVERYVYDAVGSFLAMQHRGSDPVHPGWTRSFSYDEASLIEDGLGATLLKMSNRLSRTTLSPSGSNPTLEPYQHDTHGNIVRMPHLGAGLIGPNVLWDYKDRLYQADKGGSTTFYVYDATGQRVRKIWRKTGGLAEERIYFGGFEIWRRHDLPIGAGSVTLERETLHVMDESHRVALIEMRTFDTAGNDPAPARLIRYQIGNHLGSSSMELDENALIVSYEEYSPYGSSTYQGVRSQTETPKRYRYTAKEHDEESGLYYYGSRYYAPWLGRWVSCDPQGIADDLNTYGYVRGSPISRIDVDGYESKKITIESEVVTLDETGKVKVARKSRSEGLIDGQGKVTVLKKSERNLNRAERAAAQLRMDKLREEMAEKVKQEEAAERERQKPPEKYKLVLAINVSSVDKKEIVQVSGGPDGNPGHTFLAIKDSSGKIIKILSYGPVKQSGIARIGCSAPGDAKYHLLAADDFETYEWDITKEQSDKALKKIDDIDKAPGTYTGTHQCTSVALEVTDEIGLSSIPRGKGNIDIPVCDDPIGVPTPYHLNKELKAANVPSKVLKGSDFKDQGVPVQ